MRNDKPVFLKKLFEFIFKVDCPTEVSTVRPSSFFSSYFPPPPPRAVPSFVDSSFQDDSPVFPPVVSDHFIPVSYSSYVETVRLS